MRRLALRALALAVLLPVLGCWPGRSSQPGRRPDPGTVRVASFDFSESRVLAAVYAEALRRAGFRVQLLDALGPREVVQPALQQGLVDLVPEYAGSLYAFLTASAGPDRTGGAGATGYTPVRLAALAAGRGIVPLTPARAQDRNGVVVTAVTARHRGLARISDLQRVAPTMVFGGPAECPERPYCLVGLRDRYGLRFRTFLPMPSRAVTAEALASGEIDVGMIETTDAHLAGGALVLLADDRQLQPPENLVPVLRREALRRHGPRLAATLDALSARLTTAAVVELNRKVELDDVPIPAAAAQWVRTPQPAGTAIPEAAGR